MANIIQTEKGKKGRALRTASRLKKQFPLFKFVYALISNTFSHLSLPQVKNLASLVLTFFYNTSFALYDIAKYFPANTSQKHKNKALVRALDALSLNKDLLDLDYIIRIQDDYHVRLKDGQEWQQLGLFSSGIYSCEAVGKESQTEGNVVVNEIIDADKVTKALGKGGKKDKNRAKEQAKWFLQTSLGDKDFVVDTYLKRMQIEESFKDLKSQLYWEKYTEKLPKKDRIEKCVVISCLSYAIQLSIGSYEKISEKEQKTASLINRFCNMLNRSIDHLSRIMPMFIAVVLMNIYRIDRLFC
jgi:hypothetical protein